MAMHASEGGRKVGVLITQEALAALAGGCFEWPRELSAQRVRWTIADSGKSKGIPLLGRGEGRQLDVKGLLSKAREAGVAVYACPIWTSLLGLEGRMSETIQSLDGPGLSALIKDAKQVVGSL
jgi:hypothetical protein